MAQPRSQIERTVPKGSSYRVRDMPQRQRPREEMERLGVSHVSDDVLLAIILRSGIPGVSVVDLARELLNKYGLLTDLARVSIDELASIRGMGKIKAQVLAAALELAKRLSEEDVSGQYTVKTPEDVVRLLREKTRTLEKEVFWVLLLNAKNRLRVPPIEITQGLLDASLVHPREVFCHAIRSASAAIIVAHNHPSGDPAPSAEDIRITKQLVGAGKIIDVKVLDHIIIGKPSKQKDDGYVSLREAGVVEFE